MDLLDFGQLLDLGNVSSSLSMTQQANQQPKVTSQTTLGTITLLGTSTGLLGQGCERCSGSASRIDINQAGDRPAQHAAGQDRDQADVSPGDVHLHRRHEQHGLESQTPRRRCEAVDSGALQVTFSQNLPSQGQVTLSATLGRVYLSTTDTPGISPTTGNSGAIAGNTGSGGPRRRPHRPTVLGNTGTGDEAPETRDSSATSPSASPTPSTGAAPRLWPAAPPTSSSTVRRSRASTSCWSWPRWRLLLASQADPVPGSSAGVERARPVKSDRRASKVSSPKFVEPEIA